MALPTLKQLRYLVALADSLHFRRAAESVHVSQPTLSAQLKELEERLGTQLVERSRGGVLLTPAGTEVAARARALLQNAEDLVELARRRQHPFAGLRRLGVLASLGPYLLPHLLPALHRTYPELQLYVREGMPDALLQGLSDGSLDLLLHPLPVMPRGLEAAALFREPLAVALAREHPLAARASLRAADLRGQTLLTLEKGHRLHDQVRALCEQIGARLALDYEGTSLHTLRQMVAMGMGLAFLPALYVRAEIGGEGDVVVRPLRGAAPTRTIGLIWRRRARSAEDYRDLAALFRKVAAKGLPEVTVLEGP